jgi:hypothetical protein
MFGDPIFVVWYWLERRKRVVPGHIRSQRLIESRYTVCRLCIFNREFRGLFGGRDEASRAFKLYIPNLADRLG